jgi:predicted nucleotidyltransferase component of viral defense system
MIKSKEIQQKSIFLRVRDQQIEKDYILSWILRGISSNNILSKTLVFKGGTVLKKAYFKDYRFSEDLDFTLLDSTISNKEIIKQFTLSFEYIKDQANIPLEIIDQNTHHDGGINFYISYIGPLGGHKNNKKVKIDIAKTEILQFSPIMKNIFINYSDLDNHKLNCYSLEECLIEKLRSTMQRMQARDFYDIWFILEKEKIDINFYINEFCIKCENKGLSISDFHTTINKRLSQYKGKWENSLKHQIHDLPDFEKVKRETMRHIRNMVL